MSNITQYETQEVPCITLDSFVKSSAMSQLDAIKIDTEGAEKFVLQGAKNTITKFKPLILLEYDNKNTKQFDYNRGELKNLLMDYGYVKFTFPGPSDMFAYG